MNVLIVEDEPIPAEYLKTIIERVEGFKVTNIADNEDDILKFIHTDNLDIIFMDIMIKGSKSGAEVALEVKNIKSNILIIFMTAYSEKEMIEYAVDADAFAYLLKPYRPNEITATLELAKKRLKANINTPKITTKEVTLDKEYSFNILKNKLYRDKKEIALTVKEQNLLNLLATNLPSVVPKDDILSLLNISELSLRSLLYRLRNKTHKDFILSFKGVGYKIATP
jgi:DNA-binding response OmpR family regulator